MKMKFRTQVELLKPKVELSLNDQILMLGSCFIENIGEQIIKNKFNCLINPFGVLYNPESIRKSLLLSMNPSLCKDYIFMDSNNIYHSWYHSSKFSSPSKSKLTEKVEETLERTNGFLNKGTKLYITFGTRQCYIHNERNEIVSNCHKQPAKEFKTYDLSENEIVERWRDTLNKLFQKNKDLKIIFTVSPYRYAKYGMHNNQLNKAVLLLSINRLCQLFPSNCFYFPAYEIVLDELRDYRFYAEDMLHPSAQAIAYIWEQFCDWSFNKETKIFINRWQHLLSNINHKPLIRSSETYKTFIQKTIEELINLKEKYPQLFIENELKELQQRFI